jgi:hypothetical protein
MLVDKNITSHYITQTADVQLIIIWATQIKYHHTQSNETGKHSALKNEQARTYMQSKLIVITHGR